MKETRSALTLISTILCAICAVWIGFHLFATVPAIASALDGLGMDLSFSTKLVAGTPPLVFIGLGLAIAGGLFLKDHYLDKDRTRLQINVITAILLALGLGLVQAALSKPMVDILERIG